MTVADALKIILANSYAIYLKTKNFHWHVSGPYFRDYHLLLDEQAAEILAVTDAIAERARKTGNTTIRSIGDIARHQTIKAQWECLGGVDVDPAGLRDFERLAGVPGTLLDLFTREQRVLKWTGMRVGIGIGHTKTLAKAAQHASKVWRDKTGGVVDLRSPKASLVIPIHGPKPQLKSPHPA